MEYLNESQRIAISPYWTPAHIDVTDAPLRYAAPKPSWLDRMDRHHPFTTIDSRDRSRRRAISSNAVVHAWEMLDLPPVRAAQEGRRRRAAQLGLPRPDLFGPLRAFFSRPRASKVEAPLISER
jgi:hypothetical protein